MTERRRFLTGLAGAVSTTVVAGGVAGAADHADDMHMASAGAQPRRNVIPDVVVQTHDGRTLKLHSDLIKGRVVTINFMSIATESKFPISARMAAMAKALGPRLGRDVTMISITTDPANDTAEKLAHFAGEMGAGKGWVFVRASNEDADHVASRFYRHGRDLAGGRKSDIVQYGNDGVGLWGAFPSDIQAHDAATRVTWVMNGTAPSGPLRRAGPRRLAEAGEAMNNRKA
jgi:cytochrome oxidase Cu insertion factor (SCO1/SenC/PrrC family)